MLRIVVFCMGLMTTIPAAWADTVEDCLQVQDSDRQIRGEIITGGRDTKNNLAVAYYNRGVAYGHKGDYDLAIADLNKAIELNPKYANAFELQHPNNFFRHQELGAGEARPEPDQ